MQKYRIKNWEKHQHYQSGRGAPPWIKLYKSLLDDPDWFSLPPDAAKFLVNAWLLASENQGFLPASNVLAFRLRLDSKEITKHINTCSNWIISDASNVLAKCYQDARAETETETETETDKKLSPTADYGEKEILDYLNSKTGSNFKPVQSNLKLIESRIKEGATIEEMKRVVDLKFSEWSEDVKMREYLRPATLFNATKYSQYAGSLSKNPIVKTRGFVC